MRETRSETSSGPRRFMGGAAISTNIAAPSSCMVSVLKGMGFSSCAVVGLSLPQRSEARANLFGKELRLFPGREVAAFLHLVVVNQFGIRPLCPAPRRRIEFVRKDAHGRWDHDPLDGEERRALVLPI